MSHTTWKKLCTNTEKKLGLVTILGKPGWASPVFLSSSKVIKLGNGPYYLE